MEGMTAGTGNTMATDLKVGIAALRSALWRGTKGVGRLLMGPPVMGLLSMGASTALTVAIPVLAINAHLAPQHFPDRNIDLSSAGRLPNIHILAADGTELGARGSELGDPVKLSELPDYVVDSFLATEDRRFYNHPGFDLSAMVRAVVRNYQSGEVVQGGSTITQQLVKNLFLSGEQTYSRKLEELHLALWLEAQLTKDEILELYLNRIYLGANTYGLDAASQRYFSKPPEELTLAEASLLAGLPKAPSQLAPHTNYDGALARSHEVIQNLREDGRIDEETAQRARMFPPVLNLRAQAEGDGYFLDHVAAELRRVLPGLNEDVIVRTTLHPPAQRAAIDAVAREMDNETAAAKGAEQAALIAYDRSGGIIAMIGGTSYAESQFNRTTQARRQPGSAFKPFIFLTAIEAGYDPDMVLVDQPISVEGWQPSNYKKRFLGAVRMREALARSSNTTTVQLTEAVGRESVIDTARRMGLVSDMAPHPSLALGVFEIPLSELTASYIPFIEDGLAHEPYAIAQVQSRKGDTLYIHAEDQSERVMSARTAERMTDLLHAVTQTGTGRGASIQGHEVAGKTGTTNGWRDAWFVGYSSHIIAGVWVGNDGNHEMDEVSGATYPTRIWRAFMQGAHDGMALPSVPLNDPYQPVDPGLVRLRMTYQSLGDELRQHLYPNGNWQNRYQYDAINDILTRQTSVNGQVGSDQDYLPSERVPGARRFRRGDQVTGQVDKSDGR